MSSRRILWPLGLAVLLGCGSGEQPTVRRHVQATKEQAAAVKSTPIADGARSPAAPRKKRPQRDPAQPSKLFDSLHPKRAPSKPPLAPATPPVEENTADPPGKTNTSPTPDSVPNSPPDNGTPAPKGDAAGPAHATPKDGGKDERSQRAAPGRTDAASREVRMGGVRLRAPKSWPREEPPVDFILAEFSLPHAASDSSDAQLTIAKAIDNDAKSVRRLREQLKEEELSEDSTVEHLTIDGHEVALVDSSGDYDDANDASPSPESSGRYRALNAIVFMGNTVYFVNCTGPEKTVSRHVGEFRDFLQTLKSVE